jgi:hypothetical protein
MPFGRGAEQKVSAKSVLGDIVAFVTSKESVIVGAAASALVAVASSLHVVISNASVASILTPLVTSLLVEIDKKLGVASKVATAAQRPFGKG